MQTKPTSVRLSGDLTNKLDNIAAALDRPRSWVIEQAITGFVEEQSELIQAVEEAKADLDAGQGRDWEEVKADMRRIIAARRAATGH